MPLSIPIRIYLAYVEVLVLAASQSSIGNYRDSMT